MLKTIRKHGITLALFAAGSTGLTAAINQLTKSTIDEQAALQQKHCSIRCCPAIATIITCLRAVIWSMRRHWAKVLTACILPARRPSRCSNS